MSNKKVLVTGGLGYIGSNVVIGLIESGYSPIILDDERSSCATNFEGINKICDAKGYGRIGLIKRSLESFETEELARILEVVDCVVHLAGEKRLRRSKEYPVECYENNVSMLIKLLSCIDYTGTRIPVVFASSASVTKNMDNPYTNSKKMGEIILQDWVKNGNIGCSLRIHNPIGTHESGLIGRGEYKDLVSAVLDNIFGDSPFHLDSYSVVTSDGSPQVEFVTMESLVLSITNLVESIVEKNNYVSLVSSTTVDYDCTVLEFLYTVKNRYNQLEEVEGARRIVVPSKKNIEMFIGKQIKQEFNFRKNSFN